MIKISEPPLLAALVRDVKNLIRSYKTLPPASAALGLSQTYLCGVANGRQKITEKMAKMAGWKLEAKWKKSR